MERSSLTRLVMAKAQNAQKGAPLEVEAARDNLTTSFREPPEGQMLDSSVFERATWLSPALSVGGLQQDTFEGTAPEGGPPVRRVLTRVRALRTAKGLSLIHI